MAQGRSTKIIAMSQQIRTSRLPIKNSLSPTVRVAQHSSVFAHHQPCAPGTDRQTESPPGTVRHHSSAFAPARTPVELSLDISPVLLNVRPCCASLWEGQKMNASERENERERGREREGESHQCRGEGRAPACRASLWVGQIVKEREGERA